MLRRLIAHHVVLLTSCWLALAGCVSKQETPSLPGSSRTTVPVTATTPSAAAPTERSILYLPMDAPSGTSKAVIVEGYPLAYTRQLLPVDPAGKLVGEGAPERQIEQVLANLQAVLESAGSGLDKLVRVHICADSPQTADELREQLAQKLSENVRPATTSVVTPLPMPKAAVAVDAVAVAMDKGGTVALVRCDTVAGSEGFADAAVLPRGGIVYLSGHPDKSPLPQAAGNSIGALLSTLDHLNLDRSLVVRMKAFVQSAAAADQVRDEIKKHFPGQLAPPIVFVPWMASAPIEIEMIARLPRAGGATAEPVRFYNPPEVKKPSPTFSRVALVQTDRQIYIAGLSSRSAGNAEAQVRDVFAQLKAILEETGSDLLHLAKATYYVSDDEASKMLGQLRPEYYDPKRPPAASLAKVQGVGQPDRTLTIDMIAVPGGT